MVTEDKQTLKEYGLKIYGTKASQRDTWRCISLQIFSTDRVLELNNLVQVFLL